MRWAVVLAGGVGSRFWPVSTSERPKQLLALAGSRPLVVDSVERLLPLVPAERVLLVGSRALQDALRRALPGVPAANVLAEPHAASTAPALAWATARARAADPAATVLSVHADWTVGDPGGFRAAAAAALDLAEREDVLVTVGARASRPEIGYGYIVPGEPIGARPGVPDRALRREAGRDRGGAAHRARRAVEHGHVRLDGGALPRRVRAARARAGRRAARPRPGRRGGVLRARCAR